MRGPVVLDHLRMVDRDVSRTLLEIVYRITAFAHHLGHQTVRLTDRFRRVVDEPRLCHPPRLDIARPGLRRQLTDLELVVFAFARKQFPLRCALAARCFDGVLVLRPELFSEPFTALLTHHRHTHDHREQHDDQGDHCNDDPTPCRHFLTSCGQGYPSTVCRNVNMRLCGSVSGNRTRWSAPAPDGIADPDLGRWRRRRRRWPDPSGTTVSAAPATGRRSRRPSCD